MRRGQLQLTETVFVVFIILIIIVFGFIFYSRAQEGEIKERQVEQHALRSITLGHTITRWPELECSILESSNFDCIDRLKLDALSSFLAASPDGYEFNYYRDLLGRSKISVVEIYPGNSRWMLFNNTFPDRSAESIYVPVNLLDPRTNTFSFALMELVVYE